MDTSGTSEMESYTVPALARLFNALPHINFTFSSISATFRPGDQTYRECLLLWAAGPVLWMLLLLLLQLFYFSYRCCRQDIVSSSPRSKCLNWTAAVFAIITCGLTVGGFFGSDDVYKGSNQFLQARQDFHRTINKTKAQVVYIEREIVRFMTDELTELRREWSAERGLSETRRNELQSYSDRGLQALRDLSTDLHIVNSNVTIRNFSAVDEYIEEHSVYRWIGMMAVLGSIILLLLLLLCGLSKSSKPALLVFCALGILCLVICWLAVGLHLAIGMAVGDFCVAPNPSFERTSINKNIDNIEVLDRYYVRCNDDQRSPFSQVLQNMYHHTQAVKASYDESIKLMDDRNKMIMRRPGRLDSLFDPISALAAYIGCTYVHKHYLDAVRALCYTSLTGLVMLLVCLILVGLLLPVLVIMASAAWRRQHKSSYATSTYDERGVFLPRHDQHSSPAAYSTYMRQGGGPPKDQQPMVHRQMPDDLNMPPPGYNTSVYYRSGGGAGGAGGPAMRGGGGGYHDGSM